MAHTVAGTVLDMECRTLLYTLPDFCLLVVLGQTCQHDALVSLVQGDGDHLLPLLSRVGLLLRHGGLQFGF